MFGSATGSKLNSPPYRLIERQEDYRDLGGDYFDKRRPDDTVRRLTQRLEQLGYQVTPTPQTPAVAA